jgi:hypothetical protein
VKPNTLELGCELLEPKLNVGVLVAAMTAAVVVAGLLLPGLLAPNTEDDAPNAMPLAGVVAWNNDGITVLDVVTAVDPKLKAGPT